MGQSLIDDLELRTQVLTLVAIGLPPKSAASICGLHRRTWADWEKRAREEEGSAYAEFLEQVVKAEAESERLALLAINRAVTGWTEKRTEETVTTGEGGSTTSKTVTVERFDWKAAALFLERRFPDRWSLRQTLEHTGDEHFRKFIVEGDNPFLHTGATHVDSEPTGGPALPREESGEPSS